MKHIKLFLVVISVCFLSATARAQGFYVTYINSDVTSYTNCDSILTLSVKTLSADTSADINFWLDGNNISVSTLNAVIEWGDGTTSTHTGYVNTPGYPIPWNPPLQHTYYNPGQYSIVLQVDNLQNGSSVADTVVFNNVICNSYLYAFASLDCDNDGNQDSTISNGIPLIISSGPNTYNVVTSNGMVNIPNMMSGTYTAQVNPNWLNQNGYGVASFYGNTFTVTPNMTTFTSQINLICDTVPIPESCVSGYIFCDQDQNGTLSLNDIPLYNAPIIINAGGVSTTVYSNLSGYYQATLFSEIGTPAVVTINQNWLNVNDYTVIFTSQTILTSDCNGADTLNIPVNCGDTISSNGACVGVYVFCDANENGMMDGAETPIDNAPVTFINNMMAPVAVVYTNANGYAEYCSNFINQNYLFAQINQYWMQQHGYTSSTSQLIVVAQNNQSPIAEYFPINCGSGTACSDLYTTVTPLIGYYQGTTAYIMLNIGNYGPGNAGNYTLTMNYPAGVTLIPSSIGLPGYTLGTNSITWNLTNAYAGFSNSQLLLFNIPTGIPSGTPHYYTSSISAVNNATDCNTTNNSGNLLQLVGSSYDPNDKTVDLEETLAPDIADVLTYTVRFQNTGTAPAQNIYIIDTLSTNLDWSTFEVIESSHAMHVVEMGNGIKRFEFPQIWLADSTSNEPESHGHLVYRIKENENNPIGSGIFNTAYIYFDWNDPIQTNTTYNYNHDLGITKESAADFTMYPNPARETLKISGSNQLDEIRISDLTGKTIMVLHPRNESFEVNISHLSNGVYTIIAESKQGISSQRFIKQ